MKIKRKIIEINDDRCTGCGKCVMACAEGAIAIIDGKARVVKDSYCDGLGACIGECPEDALEIIEREADEFDPEAVEGHLQKQGKGIMGHAAGHHVPDPQIQKLETIKPLSNTDVLPCGCPSTHIQMFNDIHNLPAQNPCCQGTATSSLTHWPVQIRLVPPTAPFLNNADILVAADCTPVAYPDFHGGFLKGKVCLIGCPKFDDTEFYINRFAEIFKTANIKNITVLIMEVPCCSKLPGLVKKGMELSGKKIPLETVTIGARGNIVEKKKA